MDVADGFAELFAGCTEAFGGESGGCLRNNGQWTWRGVVDRHLSGQRALGVYPLIGVRDAEGRDVWMCRWGALDYDVKSEHHRAYDADTEDHAHALALNLFRTLHAFGVRGWIERTRSSGRHVWVFAERWVPAATMRRALLGASSIAGTPTREVNPKQEDLRDLKFGNYVNLPYFGPEDHACPASLRKRVMLTPGFTGAYTLRDFVLLALEHRAPTDALERMAALWTPPPEPERIVIAPHGELTAVRPLLGRLNGLGYVVYRHGPEDGDRSRALVYLAHQCKVSGLSPTEALLLVTQADAAWGKFAGRRDRDKRLREIVERAWR